jgi:hypothetical protein
LRWSERRPDGVRRCRRYLLHGRVWGHGTLRGWLALYWRDGCARVVPCWFVLCGGGDGGRAMQRRARVVLPYGQRREWRVVRRRKLVCRRHSGSAALHMRRWVLLSTWQRVQRGRVLHGGVLLPGRWCCGTRRMSAGLLLHRGGSGAVVLRGGPGRLLLPRQHDRRDRARVPGRLHLPWRRGRQGRELSGDLGLGVHWWRGAAVCVHGTRRVLLCLNIGAHADCVPRGLVLHGSRSAAHCVPSWYVLCRICCGSRDLRSDGGECLRHEFHDSSWELLCPGVLVCRGHGAVAALYSCAWVFLWRRSVVRGGHRMHLRILLHRGDCGTDDVHCRKLLRSRRIRSCAVHVCRGELLWCRLVFGGGLRVFARQFLPRWHCRYGGVPHDGLRVCCRCCRACRMHRGSRILLLGGLVNDFCGGSVPGGVLLLGWHRGRSSV